MYLFNSSNLFQFCFIVVFFHLTFIPLHLAFTPPTPIRRSDNYYLNQFTFVHAFAHGKGDWGVSPVWPICAKKTWRCEMPENAGVGVAGMEHLSNKRVSLIEQCIRRKIALVLLLFSWIKEPNISNSMCECECVCGSRVFKCVCVCLYFCYSSQALYKPLSSNMWLAAGRDGWSSQRWGSYPGNGTAARRLCPL